MLGFILSFYLFCIIMHLIFPHGLVLYSSPQKNNLKLDIDSLTNVDIIVSGGEHEQPCPPELTNSLSNTNLFTPNEQKLLREIPLLYGNITTNSGPPGTVLLSLRRKSLWGIVPSEYMVARFQFTNSDMVDEVLFDHYGRTVGGPHIVRNKAGDGYDVKALRIEPDSGYGGPAPEFQFAQIKHGGHHGVYPGIYDGLWVDIRGDHCISWMRFSNGLAVDQWLYWSPYGNKLSIWVKFKEPYDYWEHSRTGFGS
jgi:hypothetical protein